MSLGIEAESVLACNSVFVIEGNLVATVNATRVEVPLAGLMQPVLNSERFSILNRLNPALP